MLGEPVEKEKSMMWEKGKWQGNILDSKKGWDLVHKWIDCPYLGTLHFIVVTEKVKGTVTNRYRNVQEFFQLFDVLSERESSGIRWENGGGGVGRFEKKKLIVIKEDELIVQDQWAWSNGGMRLFRVYMRKWWFNMKFQLCRTVKELEKLRWTDRLQVPVGLKGCWNWSIH